MFSHADLRHGSKSGVGGKVCGNEVERLVEGIFGELIVADVAGLPGTLEVGGAQCGVRLGIFGIASCRELRRMDCLIGARRLRGQQSFRNVSENWSSGHWDLITWHGLRLERGSDFLCLRRLCVKLAPDYRDLRHRVGPHRH